MSDKDKIIEELRSQIDYWEEMCKLNVDGWGFPMLMIAADALLERYYPEHLFDGSNTFFPSTDPGVKLVQALRECRKVTDEQQQG